MTSRQQERGRPPPKTSSREGIPVEMVVTELNAGDVRVPGTGKVALLVTFRLKEDIPAEGRTVT